MNSLQKACLLFVAVLLLGANATGSHSNLESFSASPVEGTPDILVQWTVHDVSLLMNENETSFELSRKSSGNGMQFQQISNDCIAGQGNSFSCTDSDMYKGFSEETASTESVTYKLRATHKNGRTIDYGETTVEYTTNAVRRTWGSIKSMFQ